MVNTKEMTESLIKELAFSEEELRELKAAKEKPIVFDEDCPETTPERALKFRRVNPPRGAVSKISWRKIYLPGTAGTLYRVSWLLYL